MKKFFLEFRNAMRYVKRRLVKWLSYIILIFSVFMLFIALGTNVAHRVPIISYFVKEMKMPYSLSLSGSVNIFRNEYVQKALNSNGENEKKMEVDVPVTISAGGYCKESDSFTQFELNFNALEISNIPIVVTFSIDGKEYTYIEYLDFENHEYRTTIDLVYYLED